METNSIKDIFKKIKWQNIIIAVFLLVLGIICVVLPNVSGTILCYIVGAIAIAAGIVVFIDFCYSGFILTGLKLATSIVLIMAGIFLFVYTDKAQTILTVLFGVVIIFDSLKSVADSIDMAKAGLKSWIFLFLISLVTLVLGGLVMFSNFDAVMIIAGVSLIVEAVREIVVMFIFEMKIKEAKKTLENTTTKKVND